jgi:hypothetical protein
MTGTNCDLFTHNQSRSYLNHLVFFRSKSAGYRAELWTRPLDYAFILLTEQRHRTNTSRLPGHCVCAGHAINFHVPVVPAAAANVLMQYTRDGAVTPSV